MAADSGDHDIQISSSSIEGTLPNTEETAPTEPEDFERGFRFWVIIIGLAVSTLLAALEHTVVTTAAPYILQDLGLKENFIWITNAFFVCRLVLSGLLYQFLQVVHK
jgi:hypothetical protein